MTPGNVVPFPKSRRRTRKAAQEAGITALVSKRGGKDAKMAAPCKVLQFTGTKRFNYDREEVLKNWQEHMVAMTRKLHVDAINGSLTGLLYVRTLDGPDGEIDGDWSGLVCEDLDLTADVLDQWSGHVEKVRKSLPGNV